ncbi:methyltransferase [Actinomadura hibisca]|uniref:methyltransferase n=1 Tax=Actinomadura hibisca TaxID=68565 RepID=UPI00082CE871|nr:methyltransferase [Actinomadura hibisca]
MTRSPLLDLAYGYMPAQIVYAAAELGLADALADGPRSSAELAAGTGTHAPSLLRLLRALTVLGVTEQHGPDLFALAPAGQDLRRGVPGSVRNLVLLFCGPDVWRTWGDLMGTLRTGEYAWERVTGMTPFEFFARDQELSATFNAAMAEHTRAVAPAVIEAADLGRFGTVADLGGGDGTLLAAVLRAVPGARGVLFDLPPALESAKDTLGDLADRCEIVPGDFFAEVPSGADAYLLKSVIHDWDDERTAAILRSCRAAMRPEARLLLVETLMPPVVTAEHRGVAMGDLNMLVATGGRERTEAEFRELLTAAGFATVSVSEPLPPSGYRVLEAAPA